MLTINRYLIALLVISQIISCQDNIDNGNRYTSDSNPVTQLQLPEISENAISGTNFANYIASMDIIDREKEILRQIADGNIPTFSRELTPITISKMIDSIEYNLTIFSTTDYMAIGSDENYFYIPMTPIAAQFLADKVNCILPTKIIVDKIYSVSNIKLRPQPIPPSDKMITVPVFVQHADSVKQQINSIGYERQSGDIIAGHKKDVIISNKIYSDDRNFERVVIYGWHMSENNPIQPVYSGHNSMYTDYSHGVRLISKSAYLNGELVDIEYILNDADFSLLLSDEGIISKPFYPGTDIYSSINNFHDMD